MDLGRTESQNLARFRLYAPFVKSLEVYGRNSREYEVKGWNVLAQYAKDDTLLPNLLHLTLTAPFPIESRHQMLWIRTFLAPSIIDVQVISWPPSNELPLVHIPTARSLLTHISKVVPTMQRLSLFIEEKRFQRPEEDADMMGFWELPLSDCFKNLPALQEITTTEAILGADVFRAVSGLAKLKVLDIWAHYGFTGSWDELDPKSLPSNPFPALEHFSMRRTDAERVRSIFKRPVFSNLSSLRLDLCIWQTPEAWQCGLIELIARACPRLTTLNIAFEKVLIHDDPIDLLELAPDGSTALSLMSKLPLKTVHISNAALGLEPNSVRADALQLAWPLVTELSMPDLRAGFEELYEFSQLPDLQELTLGLNLEDCPNDDFFKRPIGSLSLRTLCGSTETYISTTPDISAKALLHCWPNLEEVVYHISADDPARRGNPDCPRSHIDEINRELQQLQALRVVQGRERGESSRKRGRAET
ncbi:hypothetical protein FS749_007361 [Ceratobasidium sp. UAMH 11750]|nr:hypothetical protein FS749_007361 [Ceratobasidium sp. UAMH 11750]